MFASLFEKLQEQRLVVALSLLVVLLGGGWLVTSHQNSSSDEAVELVGQVEQVQQVSAVTSEIVETHHDSLSHFTVDVKGAVKEQGVYELQTGSRVTDAIQKAGGLTNEADRNSINLAAKVTDEMVIYVAKVGEEIAPDQSVSTLPKGSSSQEEQDGAVHLNSATVQDLKSISGIGEKRAQDIISYRDSNGGFKSIDELKNVSGIGEKTLENIRSQVRVD